MKDSNNCLKNELLLLKEELDKLLCEHAPGSEDVIRLSKKLDELILKYYRTHKDNSRL